MHAFLAAARVGVLVMTSGAEISAYSFGSFPFFLPSRAGVYSFFLASFAFCMAFFASLAYSTFAASSLQ